MKLGVNEAHQLNGIVMYVTKLAYTLIVTPGAGESCSPMFIGVVLYATVQCKVITHLPVFSQFSIWSCKAMRIQ